MRLSSVCQTDIQADRRQKDRHTDKHTVTSRPVTNDIIGCCGDYENDQQPSCRLPIIIVSSHIIISSHLLDSLLSLCLSVGHTIDVKNVDVKN